MNAFTKLFGDVRDHLQKHPEVRLLVDETYYVLEGNVVRQSPDPFELIAGRGSSRELTLEMIPLFLMSGEGLAFMPHPCEDGTGLVFRRGIGFEPHDPLFADSYAESVQWLKDLGMVWRVIWSNGVPVTFVRYCDQTDSNQVMLKMRWTDA